MDHGAHHDGMGASAALFVLLVLVPAALLCIYLALARRERRRQGWNAWRTTSFTVGILLVMAAMLPPVADWAHGDLRGHMLQHLLLGMFGPLGLVLGAPGTLLLRNVPVRVARRIVALLERHPIRLLIHPITAALLNVGAMYVLYLTPLFALSMSDPVLHVLLHVHFVIAGYLFTWSIAGPDPAPRRPGMVMRLAVLFVATGAHATLGKLMYGHGHPHGTLAGLDEVRAAAQWMYYGGDLAELLLIIAFFAMWFRRRNTLPVLFGGEPRDPQQAL